MLGRAWSLVRRGLLSYKFYVVLGIVLGLTVAPIAWTAGSSPDGTIAVVPVEGTITGNSAETYATAMRQARENPNVDAVVLVVNSGGGSAAASEEMYLETKRTAREMPVVAAVDAGALSGAYYTIAPADYIYTKPAGLLGSIGVLATLPQDVEPNDVVATTGPDKLTGADQRRFFAIIDSFQNAFLGAVMEQRGENLTVDRAQLAQAGIYGGSQAVDNGLADRVGAREDAVRHAARMAALDDYRIRVFHPDETRFVSRNNYLASSAPNKTMMPATELVGDESSPVVLMVPRSYVADAIAERTVLEPRTDEESVNATSDGANATGGGS